MRSPNRLLLISCAFAMTASPGWAQVVLTGAFNFSTNSSGAVLGAEGQGWNTLSGDPVWGLWFARNADATSPINGPVNSQVGISIPLESGQSYKFYIFGQPNGSIGFNGLNLFFDGNDSTPGISVFGRTNSSLFSADSSTTYTLTGTGVVGAGRTYYTSGATTVVLTGYNWNSPSNMSPDVCQPLVFEPGDGPDFYGSFTLHVSPAAALVVSPGTSSPGSAITLAGSEFTPFESINIYLAEFGSLPRYSATADASGAFLLPVTEAQAPFGDEDYFGVGLRSGKLGAATTFVSSRMAFYPSSGLPGSTTNSQGVGFGAGETVQIYWNNPRQLLGTAVANGQGSFVSTKGIPITIPLNAPAGINEVIGVGEATKAIGLGTFIVE